MMGAAAALAFGPPVRLARAETAPALGEMSLGRADAPVTVIEYFSLGCIHCRDFYERTFGQVKTNYIETGKVYFVLRDYPTGPSALRAAMLARCAGPARYLSFVDAIFDAFDYWTGADDKLGALAQIAALGGIGRAEFDACIADPEIETVVLTNQMTGTNEHKVEFTPTFIVNGEKVVGALPYDDFARILDRHLADG